MAAADKTDNTESTTLSGFVFVAASLGVTVGLSELFRKFPMRSQEPTLAELATIANEYGVKCKPLQARVDQLPSFQRSLPALLRVAGDRSLVLERVEAGVGDTLKLTIRDPLTDRVAVTDEGQLASVWDGTIILFKRAAARSDDDEPFGIGWLWNQVIREKRLFLEIFAAATLGTVFALAPPFIFMIVSNRVLVNNSFATLHVLAALVLFLIFFEALIGHTRRRTMEVATARIDARLNLHMLNRVLRLPIEFFEKNPTGRTLSRINRLWVVRNFLTGQLFGALVDAVPLLGIIPALFILNWRLAILVTALGAVMFIIVLFFIKPIGQRFTKVVIAEQRKGSHLVETLHGIRTIKSLSLEGRRRKEWDSITAEITRTKFALGNSSNWPQTLSVPIERLMYSGSVIVGAYIALTSPDAITAGALGAFSMLAMRVALPLIQLAKLQLTMAELGGAISELSIVLNAPVEEGNEVTGVRTPIAGRLAFKDVSFRYGPGLPQVLDKVNFEIASGTSLGIVGRSGSGKTTITRLLQGLNKTYEGMIKIDGIELKDYSLSHLRSSIGIVLQENFLFSGTVRENVAIANPGAAFEDIVRACQLAGAEEFIEKLPRGYDTQLEEGAANLSGGQRQRLAIARALLSDPRMLILDEATSALDAESESIVNENLRSIAQGRTVISVSHRLSMLVNFDQIMVLDKGQLYDIGTHQELLARCDIYAHLWHQQNRHGG